MIGKQRAHTRLTFHFSSVFVTLCILASLKGSPTHLRQTP